MLIATAAADIRVMVPSKIAGIGRNSLCLICSLIGVTHNGLDFIGEVPGRHCHEATEIPASLACSVITIISEGSLQKNITSVFLGEVG